MAKVYRIADFANPKSRVELDEHMTNKGIQFPRYRRLGVYQKKRWKFG